MKIKFIKEVLKDNFNLILLYFALVFLFGSTFFLYSVPFTVYQDALLFTLPLLLLFLCWRGYKTWRKHTLLQRQINQLGINVVDVGEVPAETIEKDYQRLIAKLEVQLKGMAAANEVKEKELMDYYAMWSHQIKTPLAALDLLVQTVDQPTKAEMKEEVFKIQQYLDMMLQYLRMQSIQNDFRFEEFSFGELVRPIIKKYASFFINKDLEVELLNLENKIITDKKWFSFILEQVIFNAVKYTKAGKITVYVPENQPQMLCIKDTGQGILPEDLPRVFDKGYTGFNGRENQKATGLGLYMSKEIAAQLGILLTIASVVGEGTEVRLDVSQQLDI